MILEKQNQNQKMAFPRMKKHNGKLSWIRKIYNTMSLVAYDQCLFSKRLCLQMMSCDLFQHNGKASGNSLNIALKATEPIGRDLKNS
ncbi:hypothetical protein GYH30_030944 [Glycine max]|uniref:Uncharacterized protein n=1 Tax=Glycine max TaxID=3847 RepID=A0A0R0HGU7_SOYBN|nr:hypothetical protein GYH30_030944 [Glycine max]